MIRVLALTVALVSLAGCKKSPEAASGPDMAGWHPYKNVTPDKVKRDLEAAQQKHEQAVDKKFDEAQQQ
jgi:hypothetical protein